MNISKFLGVFFSVIFLGSSISIAAADQFEGGRKNNPQEEVNGLIGIGVLVSKKPYQDYDTKVYPVPVGLVTYKKLFWEGNVFGVLLVDKDDVEVAVIGKPRFMGYDDDDATALNGMLDRNSSIDGGLKARWVNDYFKFSVTAVTDLMKVHEGQEITAMFSKRFKDGFFTPRAGIKWQSKKLVDYYYGVTPSDTRAGRSIYKGDATLNPAVGATFAYPINDQWLAIADIEYEWLGSEITDSPIVSEDAFFSGVVGAAYKF